MPRPLNVLAFLHMCIPHMHKTTAQYACDGMYWALFVAMSPGYCCCPWQSIVSLYLIMQRLSSKSGKTVK